MIVIPLLDKLVSLNVFIIKGLSMIPLIKYCEISNEVCPAVKNIPEKRQVFSAYSSHDTDIVDQINLALKKLNDETEYDWISWEDDMEIEDSVIFCEICKCLHASKAILIELSDLNFNVVFEYGYSIGIGKKIHPIVRNDFDFKNVERFIKPLIGIGIGKYHKNKLHEKLLKKRFWEKSREKVFYDFEPDHILSDDMKINANSILYIKNIDDPRVTESIENQIDNFSLNVIIDDPHEENNSLAWYTKQIKRSYAVIIDLGMASSTDNLKHYLKCAFISGLCVATGRRILILNSVHAAKPSDIITIIKEYETAKSAGNKVFNFLNEHSNSISIISSYIATQNRERATIFDNLDLGEHVAINDQEFIGKCFIETPEYLSLSNKGYKLVIGRKGTGKSAAFFHWKSNHENYKEIIVHQLFDRYNLNDLYELTRAFEDEIQKNKIVNTYWAFVLFLIIAQNIYKRIDQDDREYRDQKDIEVQNRFLKYFEKLKYNNPDISTTDYLTQIMDEIKRNGAESFHAIQQSFYTKILIELKKEVINYLVESEKSLHLCIDGLDSNLDIKKNKEIISLILFNLHDVCSTMFGNNYHGYTINLFLRTDLYIAFKDRITEKDKITKVVLNWRPEYLMQLINSRLKENNINHIAELLHGSLNIKTLMKKIENYVFSRPRDYIVLFNNLIQIAQSQKKDSIDNRIFNDALENYALHAGESIEAEFLSLPYDIKFGVLLTRLKLLLVKDSKRVQAKKFIKLLTDLKMDEKNIKPFISFLLQIEFIYVQHNSRPINWNKLSNPEIKLDAMLENYNQRYFYFPLIIQKYLDEFF